MRFAGFFLFLCVLHCMVPLSAAESDSDPETGATWLQLKRVLFGDRDVVLDRKGRVISLEVPAGGVNGRT